MFFSATSRVTEWAPKCVCLLCFIVCLLQEMWPFFPSFFLYLCFFCCQQFDFCGDNFWSNVESDSSERPSVLLIVLVVFVCCIRMFSFCFFFCCCRKRYFFLKIFSRAMLRVTGVSAQVCGQNLSWARDTLANTHHCRGGNTNTKRKHEYLGLEHTPLGKDTNFFGWNAYQYHREITYKLGL